MSFFHQFPLEEEVRNYFVFASTEGILYRCTTVPTGSTGPPLLAQIIMVALKRHTTAQSPSSRMDGFIDDMRVTDTSQPQLIAAAKVLLHTLHHLGITKNPGSQTSPYTFLGLHYVHEEPPRVTLGSKTIAKLTLVLEELRSPNLEWTLVEIQHAFGLTVWAARALHIPLANHYAVFKFVRRRSRTWSTSPHIKTKVWPCIVHQWTALVMTLMNYEYKPVRVESTGKPLPTLATDASLWGRGAIYFADEVHCSSAQWPYPGEHINVLELRALAAGLQDLVPDNAHINVIVDNTTAMHVTRRGYSRSFRLNNELRKLLSIVRGKNITIHDISYISSENNPADPLSRPFSVHTH
jgi:hypothetical protein